LTPLFVVPVEWVLLGDAPARIGLLGVALVVLGVYLLNIRTIRSGLFAPLAALAGDPSARKALAVALLWSVGGVLDRVSVLASSPAFYAFMLSAGLAAGFFPLVLIARRSGSEPAGIERPKSSEGSSLRSELAAAGRGALVLHGFLIAAMLTLQMEALTLQLASYVLSIKRMGAVLAVVIGYVAFREQGLGARLLGTLVAIGGAAILVVLG
jgi:uncharacterized membrane protein